jgi:nucleotide-binding universal stress UspA family protein
MHILLAVDASPDSRQAAQMIKHFAEAPNLDVLNVVDIEALKHAYDFPRMPAGYYDGYREEVSAVAERVLHEVRAELSPCVRQIRLIADTGDAAESIIQTAEESRAQLIVLGQRGMTATPAFLLGGVSQKVATYAPCSVLVVKQSLPALDRILLAVDGSDASNRACQWLSRSPFKGVVRLLAVTVWTAPGALARLPATEAARASGENLLRTVADSLTGQRYDVSTEWLQGDPAFAILDAAARHEAQLIVVGARGLKAIKRFLLGSVSQKVLVHAACSVLIVR